MRQESARHFIHLQTCLLSKNIDLTDSCIHNVCVEIDSSEKPFQTNLSLKRVDEINIQRKEKMAFRK